MSAEKSVYIAMGYLGYCAGISVVQYSNVSVPNLWQSGVEYASHIIKSSIVVSSPPEDESYVSRIASQRMEATLISVSHPTCWFIGNRIQRGL